MSDCAIRPAADSDVRSVWRVHTASIRDVCSSHYKRDEIQSWTDRQRPEKYLPSIATEFFLVAELRPHASDSEIVVGFAHLGNKTSQSDGRSEMEVKGLYVDPYWTGKGIGKKLYNRLELQAKEECCSILVVSSTLNAVGFYESCGFTVLNEGIHCSTNGPAMRCVHMEKILADQC